MNTQPNAKDVIDEALEDIAMETPTAGPLAELVVRTSAAMTAIASQPSQVVFLHTRFTARSLRRIAATIIGGIAVAIIAWSASRYLEPQAAFADVVATTRAARTKTCRATIKVDGHPPVIYVQMLKEPGLSRIEFSDGQVIIENRDAGKHIGLNPKLKTAVVSPLQGEQLNDRAFSVQSLEQLSKRDQYEKLPQKQIDGQAAVGFRFAEADAVQDIWADAKTHRLILIEMSLKQAGQTTHVKTDNFKFDVPLDDSLFDLRPPAGYQLIEGVRIRNEIRRIGPKAPATGPTTER